MNWSVVLALWIQTFGAVFAIVDPFGCVPIFLSMTARDTPKQRRTMLVRACLTATVILAFFTLFGNQILAFFGISIPALQISGGLILLVIGFEMLRVLPVHEKISSTEESEGAAKEDISIIPLAIPMLSGPASIATVILLSSRTPTVVGYLAILSSVAVTLLLTYVILASATRVLAFVGMTGLNVITRVMGFLLCAMAIQLVINGILAVKPML